MYLQQYPEATPEELDSLDIVNSFNEWQPFIDFETIHSFSSYREEIEDDIIAYENIPINQLHLHDDPDFTSPILDEATRTLFNDTGYAKIGSNTISVDDFEDSASGIPFWDECGFLTSWSYIFTQSDNTHLNNREMHVKIKVRSTPAISNLKGKTVFKKKKGNRMRKSRANMKIKVYGKTYDGECNDRVQRWNRSKPYKKKKSYSVNSAIWNQWREAFVDISDGLLTLHQLQYIGKVLLVPKNPFYSY